MDFNETMERMQEQINKEREARAANKLMDEELAGTYVHEAYANLSQEEMERDLMHRRGRKTMDESIAERAPLQFGETKQPPLDDKDEKKRLKNKQANQRAQVESELKGISKAGKVLEKAGVADKIAIFGPQAKLDKKGNLTNEDDIKAYAERLRTKEGKNAELMRIKDMMLNERELTPDLFTPQYIAENTREVMRLLGEYDAFFKLFAGSEGQYFTPEEGVKYATIYEMYQNARKCYAAALKSGFIRDEKIAGVNVEKLDEATIRESIQENERLRKTLAIQKREFRTKVGTAMVDIKLQTARNKKETAAPKTRAELDKFKRAARCGALELPDDVEIPMEYIKNLNVQELRNLSDDELMDRAEELQYNLQAARKLYEKSLHGGAWERGTEIAPDYAFRYRMDALGHYAKRARNLAMMRAYKYGVLDINALKNSEKFYIANKYGLEVWQELRPEHILEFSKSVLVEYTGRMEQTERKFQMKLAVEQLKEILPQVDEPEEVQLDTLKNVDTFKEALDSDEPGAALNALTEYHTATEYKRNVGATDNEKAYANSTSRVFDLAVSAYADKMKDSSEADVRKVAEKLCEQTLDALIMFEFVVLDARQKISPDVAASDRDDLAVYIAMRTSVGKKVERLLAVRETLFKENETAARVFKEIGDTPGEFATLLSLSENIEQIQRAKSKFDKALLESGYAAQVQEDAIKFRDRVFQDGERITSEREGYGISGGDSTEDEGLQAVREAVQALELKLDERTDLGSNALDKVEETLTAYLEAMNRATYYYNNKKVETPEDDANRALALETFTRLREESSMFQRAREMLRSGQGLMEVEYVHQLLTMVQLDHEGEFRQAEEMNTEEATGVHALTLEDFAFVVGEKNRGFIEYRDGKINITHSTFWGSDTTGQIGDIIAGRQMESTIANQQMRLRLFQLICERIGKFAPPRENVIGTIRRSLEIDRGATKSGPLSRATVAYCLSLATVWGCKTNQMLIGFENNIQSPEQGQDQGVRTRNYSLAKFVKTTFDVDPKQKLPYGQAKNENIFAEQSKEYNKLKINKVKSILEEGEKLGIPAPPISTHEMHNLIYGNLAYAWDDMYQCLKEAHDIAAKFDDTTKAGIMPVPEEVSKKLAALSIKRYLAKTDEMKNLCYMQMQQIAMDMAFDFLRSRNVDQADTRELLEKTDIKLLQSKGSEGLNNEVENRLQGDVFRDRVKDVRAGTKKLGELCDHMKEFSDLQEKAVANALTKEEWDAYEKCAQQIQRLMKSEDVPQMGFVAENLEGTRFKEGFRRTKELIDGGFSFVDAARILREKLGAQVLESAEQTEKKTRITVETDEKISRMGAAESDLARMLLREKQPSELIKEPGEAMAKSLWELRNELATFPEGAFCSKLLNIAGTKIKLVQGKDNVLYLKAGNQAIKLKNNARQLAAHLEDDVMEKSVLYGESHAKELAENLKGEDATPSALSRSRRLLIKYLAGKVGKPETFFTNVKTAKVKEYAADLLEGTRNADYIIEQVNALDSKVAINGEETLELINLYEDNQRDLVTMPAGYGQVTQTPNQATWTAEERKVVNLVSDMLFSEETWIADQAWKQAQENGQQREKPLTRMQLMMVKHADTLLLISEHPEILKNVINQFPVDDEAFKKQLTDPIDELLADECVRDMLEILSGKYTEKETIEEGDDPMESMRKQFVNAMIEASAQIHEEGAAGEVMEEAVRHEEVAAHLEEMERKLDEATEQFVGGIQDLVSMNINSVFGNQEEDEGSKLETKAQLEARIQDMTRAEKKKARVEWGNAKLTEMLENALKGDEGQGAFMKNVLSNYFGRVEGVDKRAMFASALRNMKPRSAAAPGADPDEQLQKDQAAFLGGFLKGAGPLLHKILQGFPMQSAPPALQEALIDMKSHLSPIPETIVRAQMRGIIDRSEGKITKIDVLKSLGAASVGQTFKCRLYGPEMPDGKDVVVKLLRPDVRNRMMREKRVMLDCAKITDIGPKLREQFDSTEAAEKAKFMQENAGTTEEAWKEVWEKRWKDTLQAEVERSREAGEIGGMEATYIGQLQRIEEELDLTLEARNVETGVLYDKGFKTVKAMKLENSVEATTTTMVLEMASGSNLADFILDMKAAHKELEDELYTVVNNVRVTKMKALEDEREENAPKPGEYKIHSHELENVREKMLDIYRKSTGAITAEMEAIPKETFNAIVDEVLREKKEALLKEEQGAAYQAPQQQAAPEHTEVEQKVKTLLGKNLNSAIRGYESKASTLYSNETLELKNAEADRIREAAGNKVRALLKDALIRQKYLTQAVESWVYEGVYGSGFYHGDLHAGNIMVDNDGLTLIDFGNATKLSDKQQTHVVRMVFGAAMGNATLFQESFHELLENTPEEVYQEKKAALKETFEEIFSMGSMKSSGQRIGVALVKAQEIGIEVPPAIYNFSQSQLRLQNTLDEVNAEIKGLQDILGELYRLESYESYKPRDFVSVMGELIENNLSASLNQLGKGTALRYIFDLASMKNNNDDNADNAG